MDIISKKRANDRLYAYSKGRFWFWEAGQSVWKESRLMKQKYDLNHEVDKLLTPEDFLSDPVQFQALEDYEVDFVLKDALAHAKPGKPAPIAPAETLPDTPAATDVAEPAFDYSGLDEQTVDTLHMAENQYTQGKKMAETGLRWMVNAVAMAHDALCGTVVQLLDNGRFAPKDDTFRAWCSSISLSKSSAYNLLRVAERFGNIELDGKSILDVQPATLLYEAAKPSAPEEMVQKVMTGEITSSAEYRAILKENQQLRTDRVNAMNRADQAEKRAHAAETREEEAWNMVSKAQGEAKAAKDDLDHEIAQTDALLEEKGRLLRECEAAQKARKDAEERADAVKGQLDAATADVNGLYEENSRLNAEKEQAEQRARKAEEALRHQPITTVVDEEEVDRRAAEKAWGLAHARNAELQEDIEDLKQQLAKAKATPPADLIADKETADGCVINIEGIWSMALPAFSRLVGTGDTLNNAAERLITLCDRIHAQAIQLIIKNDKESQDE